MPLLSFPILTWEVYSISLIISQPSPQPSGPELLNDLVIISFSLVLLLLIPHHSPLHTNHYWLTPKRLNKTRTLKGTKILRFDTIG